MSKNDTYHPINCDDYENLELACQKSLVLTIRLRNGEEIEGKAKDLFSRKNVEYLQLLMIEQERELRLDEIESFSHPKLGTVVIRLD